MIGLRAFNIPEDGNMNRGRMLLSLYLVSRSIQRLLTPFHSILESSQDSWRLWLPVLYTYIPLFRVPIRLGGRHASLPVRKFRGLFIKRKGPNTILQP